MFRSYLVLAIPVAGVACGGGLPLVEAESFDPQQQVAGAESAPLPPVYPGKQASAPARKAWTDAMLAYRAKHGKTSESSAMMTRALREWRPQPMPLPKKKVGKPPWPLVHGLAVRSKGKSIAAYGSAMWAADGSLPGPLGEGLLEAGDSVEVATVRCFSDTTRNFTSLNPGATNNVSTCTAGPRPENGLHRLTDCMKVKFVAPTADELRSIGSTWKQSQHASMVRVAITHGKKNRFYYVTTERRSMVTETKMLGCDGPRDTPVACDPISTHTGRMVPSSAKADMVFGPNGAIVPTNMFVSRQALDLAAIEFDEVDFTRGRWTLGRTSARWSPGVYWFNAAKQVQRIDQQAKDAATIGDPTLTLLVTLNAGILHLRSGRLERARAAMATVKTLRAQGHGADPAFGVDKTLATFAALVDGKKWVLTDPCKSGD